MAATGSIFQCTYLSGENQSRCFLIKRIIRNASIIYRQRIRWEDDSPQLLLRNVNAMRTTKRSDIKEMNAGPLHLELRVDRIPPVAAQITHKPRLRGVGINSCVSITGSHQKEHIISNSIGSMCSGRESQRSAPARRTLLMRSRKLL